LPVSLELVAEDPLASVAVLVALPVPPALLLEAPAPRLLVLLPLPVVPASGFAAPCCPAAVPLPARPALSVSVGDPDAAYAPATATDMQPATNATRSFFMRPPK